MSEADDFIPPEGFQSFESMRSRRSKRRRRHDRPVFDDLPKHHRRSQAVSIGWRIKTDPNGRGVFLTHDYLPGSLDWPVSEGGQVHWADIFFLSAAGARTGIIYNATIHTLVMRLAETIEEKVEEAVDAMLSDEDRVKSQTRMFLRKIPGKSLSETLFAPRQALASLGGLTLEGGRAKWLREHWDQLASLATLGESAKILPGYTYGTGLSLTTAQSNLTAQAVVEAITDFRARGEQEYDIPVDFETQRKSVEAMLRGKLWRWDCSQATVEGKEAPPAPQDDDMIIGYESNAIRV